MTTIYRYPIEITVRQELLVPAHASVRHVGLDPTGQPCIWFEVNPEYKPAPIILFVVGTGHPLPDDAVLHIGSFIHGPFVWHLFLDEY